MKKEGPIIGEAFENLMETHGQRVRSLLWRILGNPEDASDAYQETWTSIWRASARLIPAKDPWPFIRKAAVRKAIDHLRSRRSTSVVATGLPLEIPAVVPPAGNQRIDLGRLNAQERACLTLFFWEGCSVREIAEQLDVPPGTVKTWMFRARERLRSQLRTEP